MSDAPTSATPFAGHPLSVNASALPLVARLIGEADRLRVKVSRDAAGVTFVDAGIEVEGSIEAAGLIGEICMGGLGRIELAVDRQAGSDGWPTWLEVRSSQPVLACLASQYAGWTIQEEESGFFALGSGPARDLSRVEELYKELGYVDHHNKGALVIEGDKAPPSSVARKVATACGVQPSDLTILYAPTGSLAGTVQIAARVLEVALHKAHTPGQGLAAATRDTPGDQGVEHLTLGLPQPRHDGRGHGGEHRPAAAALHAP